MRAGTTWAMAGLAAVLGCLALAGPAAADDPFVSSLDLNPGGNGFSSVGINVGVPIGTNLYFAGNNGTSGFSLFKSDGATTTSVKQVGVNWLTNVNGTLLFAGAETTHGSELWTSDGTTDGTELIKDINTTPTATASSFPTWLAKVGGTLFFRANGGDGTELWKSDGTADGTSKVADINSAPGGSAINFITDVNGIAVFRADDGTHGAELWRSDGTDTGTTRISDINPAGDSGWNGDGAVLGTYFYFRANDVTHGTELWRTDGDTVERVTDINPAGDADPTRITRMGGVLYFSANDGSGPELWRTDGTSTQKVKDIAAGPSGSTPTWMTPVGNTLYFQANDGTHGPELWRSDGTAAGTALVRDINPSGGSAPNSIAAFGNLAYFVADDGTHGAEMWRSDGTAAGTTIVKDIHPGADGSQPMLAVVPVAVGDNLFFQADDGTNGLELWRAQRLPTSDLDHASVEFGTHEAQGGISSVQTVTVTNHGGTPLDVSDVQLGGADAGDYWVVSNACDGATIPVGGSCSVGLRFVPSATGDRAATLTFASDASNAYAAVATLHGAGVQGSEPQPAVVTNTITQIVPGAALPGDTTAPHIAITGLPTKIKRAKLLKGVTFKVGSDEPAAFTGDLMATARSAALARVRASAFNLVLGHAALGQGSGTRTMRLKPSRKLVGNAKRFKLQVAVTATDAAGNRTTTRKVLKIS